MKVKLDEIQIFMEENASSVQYYNCCFTYLDSLYFVRDRDEIPVELRGSQFLMDEQFNTWQDHSFSVLRANDLLVEYLTREINRMDNQDQPNQLLQLTYQNWTGNKIDMVELIYALFFSRVINNGKITIKELSRLFSQIFNLDIEKDIYRYYSEIQQRKIEQTKFLEHLKSILQYKIDQNV